MISKARLPLLLSLSLAAILVVFASAACGNVTPTETMEMDEHEIEEGEMEMEEGEHEHDEEVKRIPNDGAVIRILSPADGATFQEGEDILVEIEVENFELAVEGSHWHVYVDGDSFGMVVGEDLDQVLRGLEPGEHEISVFLALGTHEELEDGDSVIIVVEESG